MNKIIEMAEPKLMKLPALFQTTCSKAETHISRQLHAPCQVSESHKFFTRLQMDAAKMLGFLDIPLSTVDSKGAQIIARG